MYCSILHRLTSMNHASTTDIESNQKTNFLAFGDITGLLQVVDLPSIVNKNDPIPLNKEDSIIKHKKATFQGLAYHKMPINKLQWNPNFEKIATVDDGNSLVVWNKENNLYSSQMVNNRGISTIVDVKWSKSGKNISFLYEDGHIYSGTVEGKNTWYNSLQDELKFIEFSPKGDKILVSKKKEKIYVLSSIGQQIGEINLSESIKNLEIVNISWWGGNNFNNYNQNEGLQKKHLMIAFKNGTVVLIDDETDEEPVVIQTELKKISKTQWEVNGLYIAILGELTDNEPIKEQQEEDEKEEKDEDDEKEEKNNIDNDKNKKNKTNKMKNNLLNINNRSIILFYNVKGELIKRFFCPCHVNSFSWGYTSSLALAAEQYIFLAFVKLIYKWTYFNNTIVFGYLISDNKYNIFFLDIINNTNKCKLVYNLINILSSDYHCSIIYQGKDNDQYSFMITNSFCNVLDTKLCPIKPIFYAMNNEFISISDNDYIYVLQYKGIAKQKIKGTNIEKSLKMSEINSQIITKYNVSMNKLDPNNMNEFCFFVDGTLSPDISYSYESFTHNKKAKNQICNIFLLNNNLYVGLDNGVINKYNLYLLAFERKIKIDENIKYFGLSPFEKYLWCINDNEYLSIYDLENEKHNKLDYYQKETWDIKWCKKNEEDEVKEDTLEFVILQKNRLFFINNLQIEGEMQKCPDYLATYVDNEVTAVKIEKLNNDRNNDFFEGKDYLVKYENKVLREFNEILEDEENPDLKEAFDYAIKHPCNSFFSSITKKALEKMDFDTAQKTMLQMSDFEGLEFLKNVKNIEDEDIKKAEILQYNSNFDEASKKYNKMNRSDLNLAMQMKLGKWDKVTDIMSKNNNKDENLKIAYNNYADELFERKEYDKAEENYKKAGNIQGLTNIYFAKEEYSKAANMIEKIPQDDKFLEEVGDKFSGLGMCEEAAIAYIKHGNINKAMETYVSNNKWAEAIELSRKNDFLNMEQLTNKFSKEFIKSGRKLELIELYKKANMRNEVNKYLIEIACDMKKIKISPLIIKKIYVLASLELEKYKLYINDSQINNDDNIHESNNDELMNKEKTNKNYGKFKYSSKDIDRILFNQWKGAEAFHYYMLCQVQLHNRKYKEACKTSMRLTLYEKELGVEQVYKLVALCTYLNRCYKYCSEALSILQNLDKINISKKVKYKELAETIYFKYGIKNIGEKYLKCPNEGCKQLISEYSIYCKSCGINFSGCVLSGTTIFDNHYFKCKQCHHKTKKSEFKKNPINNCPLCHVSLKEKSDQ